MLDEGFVADCPYAPEAILFEEIVEIDREAGRLVARMPTHDRLVHVTGMLGFAHAYYVLGLRHADGWIGYGTHIQAARYGRLATIGPPLVLECRGTRVRRIRDESLYVRYAFRFAQQGEVVYESEQGAVWRRVVEGGA